MKIIKVEPLPKFRLHVLYGDGVSGIVDLRALISSGIFAGLKNGKVFNKVYLNNNAVAWSDEMEIDSLAIYLELSGKSLNQITEENYSATD